MKNNRNIFLSGGGNQEESLLLDKLFASSLKESGSLGYVPNAMKSRPYEKCFTWFKSVFLPLSVRSFELITDLKKASQNHQLSGLYIGGGNTGKLLAEIKESGFDYRLREYADSGLPIYGGSAGAIILGETISTAPESSEVDQNQRAGLNLLDGFSVFCHYDMKSDLDEISKRCGGEKLFAISERGGIHLSGDILKSVGYDPVGIYYWRNKVFIAPGESMNIRDFA